MKLLFAHDHRFVSASDGLVSTPGTLPYHVWQRYLEVFDELLVVARGQSTPQAGLVGDLSTSSGPGVSFQFLPSLTNPLTLWRNRGIARSLMLRAVQQAGAVIARLPSELGLLAIDCAREVGRPWLVELVGCPSDAIRLHGSLKGRLYAPIARTRVRSAVRRAPFVVYVTETYLQSRYPTDAVSVACSNVEVSIDETVIDQRLERIANGAEPFVVGTIATLGPRYKGIDVAMRAIASLPAGVPKIEYRILGGGDRAHWVQVARNLGLESKVKFTGILPAGDAVNGWLDEIDLYVQPSLTEGLPRALIEALARGCPALGSRAGGIPELLPTANLHDPGDFISLARGIRLATADQAWLGDAAIQNMNTARRYSAKQIQQRRSYILRLLRDAGASTPAV